MPKEDTAVDPATQDTRTVASGTIRIAAITMRNTKAEIFAAYERATVVKPHRPMDPMMLARLIICDSAVELSGWISDRLSAKACFGADNHARDTMEAMNIFREAQKLLAKPEGSP